MNPAPRPPSPTQREATQKALRRDNVNQLSSRDALVLMGMAGEPDSTDKARLDQFFSKEGGKDAPPRPSREMRRAPSIRNRESDNVSWSDDGQPSVIKPALMVSRTVQRLHRTWNSSAGSTIPSHRTALQRQISQARCAADWSYSVCVKQSRVSQRTSLTPYSQTPTC